MTVDELIAEFRLQSNPADIARLRAEIANLGADTTNTESNITELSKSIFYIGNVVKMFSDKLSSLAASWVQDFASSADATAKFARRVGMTVEQVQQLDYAAESSGVSIEEWRKSQEIIGVSLSKNDKGFAEVLKKIGLTSNALKNVNAGDRFNLIAEKLSKIQDETKRAEISVSLFGEEGLKLLNLFEGGAQGLEDLKRKASELGIFTAQQAKDAEEYSGQLNNVMLAFRGVQHQVAASLMPTLTKLFKSFEDFFVENRNKLVGFIKGGIYLMTQALKLAAVALAGFTAYKLGVWAMAAHKGLMLVATGFTITGRAAMFAQLKLFAIPIAIGAIIALIALLIEDFYVFFKGGSSVIGDFVKKWPILGKYINFVAASFRILWKIGSGLFNILSGGVSNIIGWFKKLGTLISNTEAWQKLKNGAAVAFEPIKHFFNWLVDAFSNLETLLDNLTWDKFFAGVESVAAYLKSILSETWDSIITYFGDMFRKMWQGVVDFMSKAIDKILEPVINFLNKIPGISIGENASVTPQTITDILPTGIAQLASQSDGSVVNSNSTKNTVNNQTAVTNNFNGITDVSKLMRETMTAFEKAQNINAELSGAALAGSSR